MISALRALSALVSRGQLARAAGLTFGGQRDVFEALGYKSELDISDYRLRYRRNAVARRVVEAFPRGTWRGSGAELIEDEDPNNITTFEKAWLEVSERLKIWPNLMRLDVLAGLGRYAALVIGGPGDPKNPLPATFSPEQVYYLRPFAEDAALIDAVDDDIHSPRYTQPTFYKIKQEDFTTGKRRDGPEQRVHWSRVIHVADGQLDDSGFGQPRLECVWNLLDDLEKVTGAGSEAFWLRAHQGYQFDVDKEIKLDPEGEADLEEEVDKFMNGIQRFFRSRGVKIETLGSDVANFDRNVDSIISQISAGTGIPQRILMGSERGQLASQQDRVNWAERVQDRRTEFAGPLIVRPLVDRFIQYGVLPTPKQYDVRWPQIYDLSDEERAAIAAKWAEINQKNGADKNPENIVVLADEIRDRILGLAPIPKAEIARRKKEIEDKARAEADRAQAAAEAKAQASGAFGRPPAVR